jgi:serine/threonine protein phosphatase PrpC
LAVDPQGRYAALFDGAFSSPRGQEAAQLVERSLAAEYLNYQPQPTIEAEAAMLEKFMATMDAELQNVAGTTALIARPWFDKENEQQKLLIAHSGDSRAVRVRRDEQGRLSLEHLTTDDTLHSASLDNNFKPKFLGDLQRLMSAHVRPEEITDNEIQEFAKSNRSEASFLLTTEADGSKKKIIEGVQPPEKPEGEDYADEEVAKIRKFIADSYDMMQASGDHLGQLRGLTIRSGGEDLVRQLDALGEPTDADDDATKAKRQDLEVRIARNAAAADEADTFKTFTPKSLIVDIDPGDVVLLLGDGVTDNLTDGEMLECYARAKSPQEAADLIVQAAASRRPAPRRPGEPRRWPEPREANDDVSALALEFASATGQIPEQPHRP